MHPKLTWVRTFVDTVNRATMGQVKLVEERDSADPIKKYVHLHLTEELEGRSYHPLLYIANAFAKLNDCVLEYMQRAPKKLVLHLSIKQRLSLPSNRNPFLE